MSQTPYLSIVATARNDNHGGNMLRRMQIFINGLLEQCRQYQLPAELIIVEWNSPVNKPRLQEVLSWPQENNPCKVRIIEVPSEIHRRFKHSEGLPLFQMIAKNVGIRRAKGEFILATNIDLLFSDQLFSFLASRQLQSGVMYRIDRYDVRSDLPLEASLEEQLAYCQENIICVYQRDGIHEVKAKKENIITANQKNEIKEVKGNEVDPVKPPKEINYQWLDKIPDSFIPLLSLSRKMYRRLLPVSRRDAILRQLPSAIKDWAIARGLLNVQPNSLTTASEVLNGKPSALNSENVQPNDFSLESVNSEPVPPPLHINACGDFTLMAKEDWFSLGGYVELEMHSFHLDSILCHAAQLAGLRERVLEDPMRLYHIEHGGGWTPKTEKDLDRSLESRQVPKMTYEQLLAVVSVMALQRQGKQTCGNIFNDENWGLVQETLPEKIIETEESIVRVG